MSRRQEELLRAALEYSRRGWRVFPLHGSARGRCTCGQRDCSSPGKHPIVRRGLHEASNDSAQVEAWWDQWPLANIAIVTGARSRLVVVDIDLRSRTNASLGSSAEGKAKCEGVFKSIDRLSPCLPRTLVGLTGGGGVHLVYSSNDEDLRNGVGRLPGIRGNLPGVDLRANGGYIVAPPSLHASGNRYLWLDDRTSIAPAPAWLKQPKRVHAPLVASAPRFSSGEGTPYGLAALRNECQRVRSAPVGTRNHQLYRSGRAMARLIAAGHLIESRARCGLIEAGIRAGLGERECHRTVASALSGHDGLMNLS